MQALCLSFLCVMTFLIDIKENGSIFLILPLIRTWTSPPLKFLHELWENTCSRNILWMVIICKSLPFTVMIISTKISLPKLILINQLICFHCKWQNCQSWRSIILPLNSVANHTVYYVKISPSNCNGTKKFKVHVLTLKYSLFTELKPTFYLVCLHQNHYNSTELWFCGCSFC